MAGVTRECRPPHASSNYKIWGLLRYFELTYVNGAPFRSQERERAKWSDNRPLAEKEIAALLDCARTSRAITARRAVFPGGTPSFDPQPMFFVPFLDRQFGIPVEALVIGADLRFDPARF